MTRIRRPSRSLPSGHASVKNGCSSIVLTSTGTASLVPCLSAYENSRWKLAYRCGVMSGARSG